ncbi:hypothetical protein HUN58_05340 [Curtobacterium sp. Csp1]|uniref:hypothetical protein n=1 Tax=unclassified Curtobacterium TaxID=257496 RepID=UPI001599C130|nr:MULTISPECIES: hypothetical protein [unclassified Curtobacterium]QKS13200.1 hypothetical protein HUN60_08640 [Curtobacterium sp. csp3]QKS19423.1 hypothetical protein HUN58_05340 [Curtobacterium sp. Csp1]
MRSEANEAEAHERTQWQLELVSAIEAQFGDRMHHNLAAPGSALAADDEALAPFHTSHLLGHALSLSLDALRSTRMLLTNPDTGGLQYPMAAHYSMLRTALESAAQAVWLLAPADVELRRRRSLICRWSEVNYDDAAAVAALADDPDDTTDEHRTKVKNLKRNRHEIRARKKQLREVATQNGLPESLFQQSYPGTGPLIREAAAATGVKGSLARGTWQLVSGLTHPSASRSLMLSTVERLDDDGVSPVVAARFTVNPAVTNMALDAALMMHFGALTFAADRGNVPALRWQPPAGLALPPRFRKLFRP